VQPSTLNGLLQDQILFNGELIKNAREVVGISGSALLEECNEMGLECGRVNGCDHGITSSTNRHIHLRDGVVLEILIVVIVEDFVIIEGHSFRPQHLREHLELLVAETLVLPLFLVPVILLR
jgi:hypothetical protein